MSRPPGYELAPGLRRLRTINVRPWVITAGVFLALGFSIAAFSRFWTHGQLIVDGPGAFLWIRLAADHFLHGHFSYWVPEMWAGTPGWAISAPTFTVLPILPFAAAFGAETAVKIGSIAADMAGAWGTYVLSYSLWRRRMPAVVAGLIYGLHPFVVSHEALAGHYSATVVVGVAPWMVWSLCKALRGEGPQWIGISGLLAGFAVVCQAELSYGLALLAGCLVAVEVARARKGSGGAKSRTGVLVRAAAAGGIALGVVAHWLFPLLRLSKQFYLTPPTEVKTELVQGLGGAVGRQPGLLLTRSGNVGRVVSLATPHLNDPMLYLTVVCLALTLVTIFLLTRHDEEGTLTAILFASAVAVLLQTGGIPLASSTPARNVRLLPFIAVGIVGGLLVGSFMRHLRPTSKGVAVTVVTASFLTLLPYFAPFVALQRLIPLLSNVRYPRLYFIAILGLALGATYPLVLVDRWLLRRAAQPVRGLFMAALCLALAGAFLVDIHPYRAYFYLLRPNVDPAYAAAAAEVKSSGVGSRVITSLEPRAFEPFIAGGIDLTSGWPHPIASKDLWRLTSEALIASPPGYRNAALGLSSTSHIIGENAVKQKDGEILVPSVAVDPNPRVLPMVRAYDQVVVVADDGIGPEMAVNLAQRGIGVVTGGSSAVDDMGKVKHQTVGAKACTGRPIADPLLGGDVAMACALHKWIGLENSKPVDTSQPGVGAVFDSPVNGLRGIGVPLDRGEGLAELSLQEVDQRGIPVGDEMFGIRMSGTDFNGISLFRFDPIPDSAGRRYRFSISCPLCGDDQPKMAVLAAERAPGDLVVDGKIDPTRVASFSLLYDQLPAASQTTTVQGSRDGIGRWRVTTKGTNPSLVVVAESWFPGWSATVDGKSAPVVQADGAFLGVAVGPGSHTIRLRYRTPGVISGFGVTTAATAVAAVLIVAGMRKRRRGGTRSPRARAGAPA